MACLSTAFNHITMEIIVDRVMIFASIAVGKYSKVAESLLGKYLWKLLMWYRIASLLCSFQICRFPILLLDGDYQ